MSASVLCVPRTLSKGTPSKLAEATLTGHRVWEKSGACLWMWRRAACQGIQQDVTRLPHLPRHRGAGPLGRHHFSLFNLVSMIAAKRSTISCVTASDPPQPHRSDILFLSPPRPGRLGLQNYREGVSKPNWLVHHARQCTNFSDRVDRCRLPDDRARRRK